MNLLLLPLGFVRWALVSQAKSGSRGTRADSGAAPQVVQVSTDCAVQCRFCSSARLELQEFVVLVVENVIELCEALFSRTRQLQSGQNELTAGISRIQISD